MNEFDPMSRSVSREALLSYIDRLYDAVVARQAQVVRSLLRTRMAMHLPRDVREDALAVSRAPNASFRAPLRLLQFAHRMAELSREEAVPPAGQLELELRARQSGRIRRHAAPGAASRWRRPRRG